MTWKTIFDISQTSIWTDWGNIVGTWIFLCMAIFLIAWNAERLSALKVKGKAHPPEKQIHYSKKSLFVIAAIVLIIVLLSFGARARDYGELLKTYNEGTCQQIEGQISNFEPFSEKGHKWESFVVSGQKFKYDHYDLTNPGFKNDTSSGGPIKPRLKVRIWYKNFEDENRYVNAHIGNSIARLDIDEQSLSNESAQSK